MPFQRASELMPARRTYGDGIIKYFDKTPPDIVCPHFWELCWDYGCPFNCAWCYLQGTFRGNKKPKNAYLSKWIVKAIQEAFEDESSLLNKSRVFNTGELADSLMEFHLPNRSNPTKIERICDKFEEQNKYKVLLLSKSNRVDFLLRKLRKQTIVSFTLNALPVAKKWEKGPPSVEKRIEAAKRVSDTGYETRIRIDPVVPVEGWESHYTELVDLIYRKFELKPERVTLGTLRGLEKTIRFCKGDRSWIDYLSKEKTGWGRKIPSDLRKKIYIFLIDNLHEVGQNKEKIALCKETKSMWDELGMDYNRCKCNCVL